MPFDVISYLLARKALARSIRPPTLKDLIIDTDKDWRGYRILNLGEPINPYDAARKIYVDTAATGLGINYYFLDAADSEVPAYKQLSITPPKLSEAYVETTQNSAGIYEIGSWIAPADSIPVLRLGVYTLHFQAEKISGNIDVRFFFELYERDAAGNETLIAKSSLSDLVTDRRNVIVSLVLPSDYVMSPGSRLVLKIYAYYLSSGANTTVRLYYQGDVRSRLATPIAKEILDTIYASITHASRHALGGPDELSLDASQIVSGILDAARIPDLDASKIVSGVLDIARIPDLSRSKIKDFWATPFWDNIPDKPTLYTYNIPSSSYTVDAGKEISLFGKTGEGHTNVSYQGDGSADLNIRVYKDGSLVDEFPCNEAKTAVYIFSSSIEIRLYNPGTSSVTGNCPTINIGGWVRFKSLGFDDFTWTTRILTTEHGTASVIPGDNEVVITAAGEPGEGGTGFYIANTPITFSDGTEISFGLELLNVSEDTGIDEAGILLGDKRVVDFADWLDIHNRVNYYEVCMGWFVTPQIEVWEWLGGSGDWLCTFAQQDIDETVLIDAILKLVRNGDNMDVYVKRRKSIDPDTWETKTFPEDDLVHICSVPWNLPDDVYIYFYGNSYELDSGSARIYDLKITKT